MSAYKVERWTSPEESDSATLSRRMIADGYRVSTWIDHAGATYPQHEHGTDQSHWIISGTLELDVEVRGVVALRAGDRDFMPAGTVHSARVIGDEPVFYLIGEK